ncbi:MAG: hypothetical protein VX574_08090 [Myxococcota bacterium]|nr:hypothetical protein [Myxococcota bacterium]
MTGIGRTSVDEARFGPAVLLFGFLLVATVVVRSFDPDSFNHDVAWILYVAAEMLDGSILYVDIVEENPPLVFWLSVPVVAVARVLGCAPILVLNLAVATGIGLAAWLAYRILRSVRPEGPAIHALSVVGLLVAFEVLGSGYEYGQRDNLFVIAVFPYVFAAAARLEGRLLDPRLALAAGLLAGLGIALKPFFLAFWLVVELFLFFSSPSQWKRLENLCIAGTNVGYAILVLVFAPSYLEMIGIASEVYDAYGNFGSPILLFKPEVGVFLFAIALFGVVRATEADRSVRRLLLVAAAGFLVVALLQGKGWDYHYDPLGLASGLLIAVILLGVVFRADSLGGLFRASSATLALLVWVALDAAAAVGLAFGAWPVVGPGAQRRTFVKELTQVARDHGRGRPVWFLSTSIVPAFPVVNLSGAGWSSRYCCLWMIPGLYPPEERFSRPFPYRDRAEMGELEKSLLDAVVEDLENDPPALLFVDRSPDKQAFRHSDFDFLSYFLRDPRFARIFKAYEDLGSVGPYRVYKRGFSGVGIPSTAGEIGSGR